MDSWCSPGSTSAASKVSARVSVTDVSGSQDPGSHPSHRTGADAPFVRRPLESERAQRPPEHLEPATARAGWSVCSAGLAGCDGRSWPSWLSGSKRTACEDRWPGTPGRRGRCAFKPRRRTGSDGSSLESDANWSVPALATYRPEVGLHQRRIDEDPVCSQLAGLQPQIPVPDARLPGRPVDSGWRWCGSVRLRYPPCRRLESDPDTPPATA
jgi:hypothetical protein